MFFHKSKITKIKRFSILNLLWIIIVLPLFAFTLHKEYYSLTKITHNPKEKTLEITMRLFTDDMELVLSKQYKKALELGTKLEVSDANQLLEIYINQQFKIATNKVDLSYKFIGKEFEKDLMYLYFEVADVRDFTQMSVQNNILTAYFTTQENITKIKAYDQHKTMLLTKRKNKEVVFFE